NKRIVCGSTSLFWQLVRKKGFFGLPGYNSCGKKIVYTIVSHPSEQISLCNKWLQGDHLLSQCQCIYNCRAYFFDGLKSPPTLKTPVSRCWHHMPHFRPYHILP